jgi:guanylate kinase
LTNRAKSAEATRLGSIIVISAPSGAGKTTLVDRLLASVPGLVFSVSYTTRPPRRGERNGREYHFVARRRFERMVAQHEFIEWASVFGQLYGTSRKAVESAQAAGQDILLDIDIQGHAQVKQRLPQSVSVFVLPPSFAELERRLRRRHLDSPQDIERRLRTAREEVQHWTEYDYLVVNDRLALATQALKTVVMAARLRRASQEGRVGEIAKTFGG